MIGEIVAPEVGPRGERYKGRMRELKASLRYCACCFFRVWCGVVLCCVVFRCDRVLSTLTRSMKIAAGAGAIGARKHALK